MYIRSSKATMMIPANSTTCSDMHSSFRGLGGRRRHAVSAKLILSTSLLRKRGLVRSHVRRAAGGNLGRNRRGVPRPFKEKFGRPDPAGALYNPPRPAARTPQFFGANLP